MASSSVSLEVIDIARPCPADWNDMRGDERVRFCRHCSLHVYNLSTMDRTAAEQLIAQTEGRLCVRFYRREDGTVTTADCDGWWRLARKRVNRWTSVAVAVVLGVVGMTRWSDASATVKCEAPPEKTVPKAWLGEAVMGKVRAPASQPVAIMGAVAVPVQPPTTQPAPATQPAEK